MIIAIIIVWLITLVGIVGGGVYYKYTHPEEVFEDPNSFSSSIYNVLPDIYTPPTNIVNVPKYTESEAPTTSTTPTTPTNTYNESPSVYAPTTTVSNPVLNVDGSWSIWESTNCSVSCGGGKKTLTRKCSNPAPKGAGAICKAENGTRMMLETKTETCNTGECPINGTWGEWFDNGACSISCGEGGTRVMSRTCSVPKFGGKLCVNSAGVAASTESKSVPCYDKPLCPIDGGWSNAVISECTKPCGTGKRTITKKCNNPAPANGGKQCLNKSGQQVDIEVIEETCNTQACPAPVNGGWDPNPIISDCDAACGPGKYTITLKCNNPSPANGGAPCVTTWGQIVTDSLTTTFDCNKGVCPIDGGWGAWNQFGEPTCSTTCGGGVKKNVRFCNNPETAYGGKYCIDTSGARSAVETKDETCNTQACPVNGGWDPNPIISDCDAACGPGNYTITLKCNNPSPANGGAPCVTTWGQIVTDSVTTSLACNKGACPINGGWGAWNQFGEPTCSTTCGGGVKKSVRFCNNPETAYGGQYCIDTNGARSAVETKDETCNTQACPINGGWSGWSSSGCSVGCGYGTITHTRTCTNPSPQNGGLSCYDNNGVASTYESVNGSCYERPCPTNGGWSNWVDSGCNATCGGGTNTKARWCNNPAPADGGNYCTAENGTGLLYESKTESCNTQACPVNGGWSGVNYGACSVSCGGGTRVRYLTCSNPYPQNGGLGCLHPGGYYTTGNYEEYEVCNTQTCPVYGIDSVYGTWVTNEVWAGTFYNMRATVDNRGDDTIFVSLSHQGGIFGYFLVKLRNGVNNYIAYIMDIYGNQTSNVIDFIWYPYSRVEIGSYYTWNFAYFKNSSGGNFTYYK
jgi:hypothetical protein